MNCKLLISAVVPVCIALQLAVSPIPASGQESFGGVGGVTRNSISKQPVAQVQLTAHNLNKGTDHSAVSAPDGTFTMARPEPGAYQVVAVRNGFTTSTANIEISSPTTYRVDFLLAEERTPASEAKPAPVDPSDVSLFSVDHPEQFPIATTTSLESGPELVVTGSVNPDVSRNVPVISLASGRVVAIHARLGDSVKKGQLLLTVRSDDVSGAFSNYRKAVADEVLARTQLERAKDLYQQGAIALNDLQIAQDTEDKAKVDIETMSEHLRLLGNNPDHPNGMVNIFAPVSLE